MLSKVANRCEKDIQTNLPIIYFHVLSIEKEDCGWNITDVKILSIHWHLAYIHQVNCSHFT